jgi:hypothetical protein
MRSAVQPTPDPHQRSRSGSRHNLQRWRKHHASTAPALVGPRSHTARAGTITESPQHSSVGEPVFVRGASPAAARRRALARGTAPHLLLKATANLLTAPAQRRGGGRGPCLLSPIAALTVSEVHRLSGGC